MAKEMEFEHLLIFGIIAFVVYHVMRRGGCRCCFNNGFSVGGRGTKQLHQPCSTTEECSLYGGVPGEVVCEFGVVGKKWGAGFGKSCQSVPGDPLDMICRLWGSDVPCNNYCCTGLFGGIIPNWELLSNTQRENYCKDKGHGVIQCYR